MDDITKIEDLDFDNTLIDEKSYKNILVYDISYKTLFGPKPLRIKFDYVDGFIRICDGIRYLVLFAMEKHDSIYKRIRYRIRKSGIKYVFSHNYGKIKVDSNDSLPLEKTFSLRNVTILVKSVFNTDKTHYYYNIFLEKYSHKWKIIIEMLILMELIFINQMNQKGAIFVSISIL